MLLLWNLNSLLKLSIDVAALVYGKWYCHHRRDILELKMTKSCFRYCCIKITLPAQKHSPHPLFVIAIMGGIYLVCKLCPMVVFHYKNMPFDIAKQHSTHPLVAFSIQSCHLVWQKQYSKCSLLIFSTRAKSILSTPFAIPNDMIVYRKAVPGTQNALCSFLVQGPDNWDGKSSQCLELITFFNQSDHILTMPRNIFFSFIYIVIFWVLSCKIFLNAHLFLV